MTTERNREAARQQSLVAALLDAPGPADAAFEPLEAYAARGLAAYRANVAALADRALAAAFPTVRALVGEVLFARLARDHWKAEPPRRGDVGEWGEGFAAWLEAQVALAPYPYLADCARLDWAVQRCERAADAELDAGSLRLLESTDPARLFLRLKPGTAVLRSHWPIATIHAAHRAPEPDLAPVEAALAARRDERVVIARQGWRAGVRAVEGACADLVECLLEGVDLGTALERAGPGLDFAAWLALALGAGWLQGASTTIERDGTSACRGD
jgi:hypothetical protein